MDGNLTNMLLWFAVFFGIIYFIIIRPNNKQQKQRRALFISRMTFPENGRYYLVILPILHRYAHLSS